MKNKYNSKKSGAKIRRLPKSYLKLVLPIQQIMETMQHVNTTVSLINIAHLSSLRKEIISKESGMEI